MLSSAVGGVKELIHNGQNGLLYPLGDITEATKSIIELTDPTHSLKRNFIVQNGRNYVLAKHSMNTIALKYKAFLQSLPGVTPLD